jgi:hypothetical protein
MNASATGSPDGPDRPRIVRLAAVGLLVRAAFRLPVLVFVGFVIAPHVDLGQRSADFPDGAFFAWLYRATLGYLVLSVAIHVAALVAIVPGAVRTVEDATIHPYAYGWLLLPWSVAVAVVTIMVAALLRKDRVRPTGALQLCTAGSNLAG